MGVKGFITITFRLDDVGEDGYIGFKSENYKHIVPASTSKRL